ncbi:Pyruvate dehydrogenase (acetyl-transferring) [Psychromonas ingrahamii 37]|uniref:Pyruvate dehydrogenase E1 component subunit alpha n=1 Tax=Psychromonas ingrahamii (strain DSM 17664 / CCUG 51855 / 37) TaxID=357804 RepID=A1T0L9_PSYIN|nr:pyruvate dehydrogenase (acetyl-transferring) E1 component subunit alpha [Psychromonas ingrahamii]ABM05284.1 Pyruvate dehydrogenase (acetyl-transferring) [Psychromonas ingrahamii 37]
MSSNKLHVNRIHLHFLLKQMIRIRRFEERCVTLYNEEKIRGFLHLYNGEEAIAVGVMQALTAEDAVLATYREHGHALARGLSMDSVMAEMFGKASGCSGGRGGSMHLFDSSQRFYGGSAIVAGALPIAVGIALADKMLQRQAVTCCFFGDGAVAEGEFHESLNLAKLWQLPILFICENNLYAMGTALEIEHSNQKIHLKAASYGLAAQVIDGMNVIDVEAAAKLACSAIRNGAGPHFIECQTYRFRGHSMFDTQLYRNNDEVEQWKKKGPLIQLTQWLKDNHQIEPEELQAIELAVEKEIDAAVCSADAADIEPVENLLKHVYTEVSNG